MTTGPQRASPMRYSLFTVCDHYPDGARTLDDFFEQILGEIVLAEELGYESYWVAEHHFHEYGVVTNPALFLAAAAQRTKRIRLGPAVSVLTFHNPLQVAEDYATLDRLSGGRLMMGVGSGYLKHEFEGFAIADKDKRERFDTSLEIVKRAWAGEWIVHDAPWFKSGGAKLSVLPVQAPHPPIFVAVLRREAAYHVGKQGNHLMAIPYATLDRLEEIAPFIAEYRKGVADGGGTPAEDELVALHTYVADTDAQARADAAEPFDLYVATRLYAKSQVYDDVIESRLALFGSVEHVVDRLVELHAMGVRHVVMLVNFGGLAEDRVHRCMRLVAEQVIPRVEQAIAGA